MQVDLTVQHNPNWTLSSDTRSLASDLPLQSVTSISVDTWHQWFESVVNSLKS